MIHHVERKSNPCVNEFVSAQLREIYHEHLRALLEEMRSRASTSIHKSLYYLCQTELHVSLDKSIK